jgi:hypothetical protein
MTISVGVKNVLRTNIFNSSDTMNPFEAETVAEGGLAQLHEQ